MIGWGRIVYGALLSAIAAGVLVWLRRERRVAVLVAAVAAAFGGPLAWNAILHRTRPDAFFVDIPFTPFPVSWQDTGSGVFTLAAASLLVGGVALRRERASRGLGLSGAAALAALLVDIYLY